MNPIIEHLLTNVMSELVGALMAALIAAVGVGGFIWKKMHTNDLQNQRMDELQKMIQALLELVKTMSCHQLEMSCDRAIEKGCISLEEKQEIEKLYKLYEGMNWNGPGKVAYETMKQLPVREDCE